MSRQFTCTAAFIADRDHEQGFYEYGNVFVCHTDGIFRARLDGSAVHHGLTIDERADASFYPFNDDGSLTLFRDHWEFVCAHDDASPFAVAHKTATSSAMLGPKGDFSRITR